MVRIPQRRLFAFALLLVFVLLSPGSVLAAGPLARADRDQDAASSRALPQAWLEIFSNLLDALGLSTVVAPAGPAMDPTGLTDAQDTSSTSTLEPASTQPLSLDGSGTDPQTQTGD